MFNIFSRLNTGGMTLNSQEIRNALYPGPVRKFLLKLAQQKDFVEATGGGVGDDRMGARELVLRFCAFAMTPFGEYHGADLDGFLSEAMRRINRMTKSQREALGNEFGLAMRRAFEIFGNYAFRKRSVGQTRRSPVNRALFEATAVKLLELNSSQISYIADNVEEFDKKYLKLFYDEEFVRSISLSTGSRYAIYTRFSKIGELFEDFLN